MAIITIDSDVVLPDAGGARTDRSPNRANAVLRAMRWTVGPTTVVGDAGSTITMATLPWGARYCSQLSKLGWKGFGTGRTLDAGWAAYTLPSGQVVPASPGGVGTGLSVVADGRSFFDAFPTSSADELTFGAPVTLTLTVQGGTIPVGTTLGGLLVYLMAA